MSAATDIAARAIGQYPLSIATSLAFESLMGIHPEIKVTKAPLGDFNEVWVNIRTLFRNFMGSIERETASQIGPIDIAEALWEECENIRDLIRTEGREKIKVVLYVSEYKKMEEKYKFAVLRRDNTDRQKDYTLTQNKTITHMLKNHPEDIVVFERKLKSDRKIRTVILTHYAYDLLSTKEFSELTLLESYTGALKTKELWYTKYYNGKDIPFIPFREDMIQIFGDAEHFRPMDIKLKREIIDLATTKNWNAVTTTEKIKANVDTMHNHMSKDIIKRILVN
jgi:hypothetical protein